MNTKGIPARVKTIEEIQEYYKGSDFIFVPHDRFHAYILSSTKISYIGSFIDPSYYQNRIIKLRPIPFTSHYQYEDIDVGYTYRTEWLDFSELISILYL